MAPKIRTTSRRLLTRVVLTLNGLAMSAVLALGFRPTADATLVEAKASRQPTLSAMVRAATLRQ